MILISEAQDWEQSCVFCMWEVKCYCESLQVRWTSQGASLTERRAGFQSEAQLQPQLGLGLQDRQIGAKFRLGDSRRWRSYDSLYSHSTTQHSQSLCQLTLTCLLLPVFTYWLISLVCGYECWTLCILYMQRTMARLSRVREETRHSFNIISCSIESIWAF